MTKKDINYELRYREIQKAFNQLCFQFREEQMKNYTLLNFAMTIATYPDPSELTVKELKDFVSGIRAKASKLHDKFIGPLPRWSWEKEDTENEDVE